MWIEQFKPAFLRRPRILWMVLGALLLVSLLPIGLYHRQVLKLSQQKLADTERVQQTEVTRSLAEEVQLFESNLHQQLISQRQILALTGLIEDVDDPVRAPQVTRLLENFVASNPNILYLTAVGKKAKGTGAGDFRADQDPFVSRALQRAFTTTLQSLKFRSDPLALGPENRPAFVMAVPLEVGDRYTGMLAAVVSLDRVLRRLRETSVRGRVVYVVDRGGHIVAHPDTHNFVPGADVSSSFRVVAQVKDLPRELRATETLRFTMQESGRPVEMIGTYSTFPEINWAVIAQRSLEKAREDAGVKELNTQALEFVFVLTFAALALGYLFAVGISTPIRALAESTRAISRGEFHQRTPVRGAAEISELAETFNMMAGDIEEYIERLKQAAEENRELFIGSIRMLAAAIDEKDPYTRGHSGRVAKYSLTIGRQLGLTAEELDRLRIAALLHDVGQDRRGRPRPEEARLAHPGRIRADEAAPFQGRQHHASGRPAQGDAARHRAPSRARGWRRLPLRAAGRPDPDHGADHRCGRHARCHHHQPALPVGHGDGLRANPHPAAHRHQVRPDRRGCPRGSYP